MNTQRKDELKKYLKEQYSFLKKSSDEYDKGDETEAKRIASHLRTLFRSTTRTTSLLDQIKNIFGKELKIKAVIPPTGNTLFYYSGMVRFKDGGKAYIIPMLDENFPDLVEMSVEEWLAAVIIDVNKIRFTRLELILYLAEQDGGVHVDRKLDEKYEILTRKHLIKWGQGEEVGQTQFALMREYAFYVVRAIERYLSDLIN